MLRTMCALLALTASSISYGACVYDQPELGEIGPDSRLICSELNTKTAAADIAIIGRAIQAPDAVKVTVDMNGQTQSLNYKLVGANWKLTAATPSAIN